VDIDLAIELAQDRIDALEAEIEAAQAHLDDLFVQRGFRPGDIIEDPKGNEYLVVEADDRDQQRWLAAHVWTRNGWANHSRRHGNLERFQVVGVVDDAEDDDDG
jgi:hypothetical protein